MNDPPLPPFSGGPRPCYKAKRVLRWIVSVWMDLKKSFNGTESGSNFSQWHTQYWIGQTGTSGQTSSAGLGNCTPAPHWNAQAARCQTASGSPGWILPTFFLLSLARSSCCCYPHPTRLQLMQVPGSPTQSLGGESRPPPPTLSHLWENW